MSKKLDLTGQRFGGLTALHPAEYIGGGTAWVCQCDCGQKAVVRTDNLRYGRTKSCGCQRRAANVKSEQPKRVRKNNTSGVSGVEWVPGKQQWKATICLKGKRYFLGYYRGFEDAVKVRRRAEDSTYNRFCANLAGYANG